MSHPTRRAVLAAAAGAMAAGRAGAAAASHRCEDLLDSIGVNVHLGHGGSAYVDRFADCAAALDDLGVRHLRDDIVLVGTEPAGQFERIAGLARKGYRFSLIFYDGLSPGPRVPPERFGELAGWAAGGLVIAEGGNEPPILGRPGAARRSAEHQAALYRAVRSDPRYRDVKVAGPSYIQGNVGAAENLADVVDLANVHAYPGAEHPETDGPGSLLRFVAASRAVFDAAPVIVTENGYHTAVATRSAHLPISEDLRARYLPRLLLWAYLLGVRRTYLYELISSFEKGDADPDSRFGLLAYDGTRSASFAAVRNLVGLFDDRSETAGSRIDRMDVDVPDGVGGLVSASFQRKDGAVLVPLWLGIDGWDRRALRPRPDIAPRPVELHASRTPQRIRLHSFGDDGRVTVSVLPPMQRISVSVTDRLSVLEIR